jgi:hypothetical protein
MSQRIFKEGYGTWIFGDGTRNPQGDYYRDGVYMEPAGPDLAWCVQQAQRLGATIHEIVPDPDLELDEGI